MTDRPDDLAALDAMLRAVEFQPRDSLGAELTGRMRHPTPEPTPPSRAGRLRRVLGLSGISALLLGSLYWGAGRPEPGTPLVDRCCQDLDGGGDEDDGLVVVPAAGKTVSRLAIYEDRDGSHSYTPGDAVRFERLGAPSLNGALGVGPLTREFCCLDYDGEGESDDALLIVGLPPDRISLAAIYEHGNGPAVLR